MGLSHRYTNIQKNYLQYSYRIAKKNKKSIAKGIVQKSFTALFPLWCLRKNDIPKMQKKKQQKTKRKFRKH